MNKLALWAGLIGLLLLGACSDTDSASDSGVQGLRLNEVLAKSESGSDWLEIYNTSDVELSLAGLVLRDSSTDWAMEEGTIAARGFVRIFCDDTGVAGRASFKLSSAGEALTLFDSAGATLDAVTFPALKSDVSWGRSPDGTGEWFLLEQPTPAAANVKGAATDGGVDSRPTDAGATNAPCTKSTDCLSQSCHKNVCISTYQNETGGACVGDGNCLSMVCVNKICAAGSSPAGSTCLKGEECASGACASGACTGGAGLSDAGPSDLDAGPSDLTLPDQG